MKNTTPLKTTSSKAPNKPIIKTNRKAEEPKKKHLFSKLNIHVPIPSSLMLILPSFQLAAENVNAVSSETKQQIGINEDTKLGNASTPIIIENTEASDSLKQPSSNAEVTEQGNIPTHSQLHSSHYLSASPFAIATQLLQNPHTSISNLPPTNVPDQQTQMISDLTPATPLLLPSAQAQQPVSYLAEKIPGKYGTLEVDASGKYTFVLDPHSPAYIELQNKQPSTDTFTLQLSNGTTLIVDIPISGQQDKPSITGDFSGILIEDTNVDSNGLLKSSGKIEVTDPDHDQSGLQAETIQGQYGSLTIDQQGRWQYIVNNNQSNIQALTQQTGLQESFTVHTIDGSAQVLSMSIGGVDDNASISGEDTGSVTEESQLQTSGTLSITDSDSGEAHFSNTDIVGILGTLHLQDNGAWTYDLDNTNPTVQALGKGATATDNITVQSADGTTHQVSITINGTNDKAVIAGTDSGAVTEESQLQVSGTLTVTDVDTGEAHFSNANIIGTLGTLHLTDTGSWTYDLDNTNPTVQALGQGKTATDTITVQSADGTTHQVSITINGTNDKAVIAGTNSGVVIEESQLQTTGTLTVTDTDSGEAHFSDTDIVGSLGTLHLTDSGSWTYDLDNTNPTVQALGKGATATDVITVHSADGTPHQISITVNGTNDTAVIAGTNSGAVTEETQLQTTGTLTVTDTDSGEAHFSDTDIVGSLGTLHLTDSGAWTYDLDNTNPTVQALGQGKTATDTITVNSADGTPHQITVTVNGTNDAAVISGTNTGQVTEESVLQTSGLLTITDTDTGEAHFSTSSTGSTDIVGTLGTLHLTDSGAGLTI
ncbi:VCBS domain-containing protein [Psychromonas sp. psych-6C06]|uniref:VCBS domain-containing protein n=1 Tax=Psychromonas sp. psych-6C06 TaxID=2058089 RepID=UPI001930F824|nr:VCBS domain-containing protein [Psychromonas sp. psych-6C06]